MIAEALADYANATARLFDEREQTVGASEVGQCARKVYWLKNSDDPMLTARRATKALSMAGARRLRGRIYEDHFWVPAMRARFGDALKFAGAEQRTFASGFLSATPDGLAVTAAECFLLECKTIDPRTKLSGPKPEHHFQVQSQLGLVRETTKYKPTHAIVSYTDTSFWNEVVEFKIVFDPAIYEIAKTTRRHDHDGACLQRAQARRLDRRRQGMRMVPVHQGVRARAHAGTGPGGPSGSTIRRRDCRSRPRGESDRGRRRRDNRTIARRSKRNPRTPARQRAAPHPCRWRFGDVVGNQGPAIIRHEANSRGRRQCWHRSRAIRNGR